VTSPKTKVGLTALHWRASRTANLANRLPKRLSIHCRTATYFSLLGQPPFLRFHGWRARTLPPHNNKKRTSRIIRTTMVAILDADNNQPQKQHVFYTNTLIFRRIRVLCFVVDCRLAAQIADFIGNGPSMGHPTIRTVILAQQWPNLARKKYACGGRKQTSRNCSFFTTFHQFVLVPIVIAGDQIGLRR
jgi:hypothetical protein